MRRGANDYRLTRAVDSALARRRDAARLVARGVVAQSALPPGTTRDGATLANRLPQRTRFVPCRRRRSLGNLVYTQAKHQSRSDGAAQPVDLAELCRPQNQRCGVRPLSRQSPWRAPGCKHPLARCAHLRAPDHRPVRAVYRHLGRSAVQTRLARRHGRCAPQRNSGCRHDCRQRLGRWRRGFAAPVRPLLR